MFDWLAGWFAEPGFRGCAFLNAHGELGAGPAGVREVVRRHKEQLRELLGEVAASLPDESSASAAELADRLMILVEGATAVAALDPGPAAALRAREMAELLLAGSGSRG